MAETVPFVVQSGFFKAAKRQGFTFLHAMLELIDNSIDAGATTINLAMHRQPNNHFTWTIRDNGRGMSYDTLKNAVRQLGYQGEYNAESISHYGVGMKYGLFAICDEGMVSFKTVKNSLLSTAKFSTITSQENTGPSFDGPVKVNSPDGTLITVSNVNIFTKNDKILKDQDLQVTNFLVDLIKNLSVYYYPKFESNPDFKIYCPNPYDQGLTSVEVKFEDPLYRNSDKLNEGLPSDKDYIRVATEKCKVNGIEITVSGYAFFANKFADSDLISWDRPRDGRKDSGFTLPRAGVYIQVGPRFATLGENNFLVKRSNQDANNLRIHVKIPKELVDTFLQVNKSKSQIEELGLEEFSQAIKLIYNWNWSEIRGFARSVRVANTNDEVLMDDINSELNEHIGVNPLLVPQIADSIPEIEESIAELNNRKKNDFVALVWEKLGKNNLHYEAERAGDKLLMRLNIEHPFVWNYLDKADDRTKKDEIVQLYARHIALTKAKAFHDFKTETMYRVIQEESNILRSYHENKE